MRQHKRFALLWLAVVGAQAAVAGAAEAAEPVDRLQIVDRSIEAHGGGLFEHSTTTFRLCSKSGCSDVRAHVDGKRFEYEARAEVRGSQRRVRSTNDTLEWWQDGEPMVLAPERSQGLRDWVMSKVYFGFLPYRLNDESVFKRDLGLESWEGRDLHKVKVTFVVGSSTDASDEYLFWFDPETARLEQFAYSYQGEPGGLRFRRGFNYRRVGGLLFYDQENWGLEGVGLSVDQISPEFVSTMERVSTILFEELRVEPVD